jgi:uncharacterized phage protein gp47/JayE
MPWTTPSLRTVREMVRNDVTAALSGAVLVANSVLRVMSDAMAGLAHLVLRYIDWLSLQLLPDTAEQEWLDRHGDIWLVNSDGSTGRKSATFAVGTVTATGLEGYVIPAGTQLTTLGVNYETTADTTIGAGPTPVPVRALTAGAIGNQDEGTTIDFMAPIAGIDAQATVVTLAGGADTESDDQLRARILFRIRNPPMGGDQNDYVAWALSIPGVTRAWAAPEMGIGTMTVRFMMDELRATNTPPGMPTPDDVQAVHDYMDTVRPVTVKDFFVETPIPFYYTITISNLSEDTPDVRARILQSIQDMEYLKSKPGQTMYRTWVEEAISSAVGVDYFELDFDTTEMPAPGYMPFIGTINYA